MSWSPLCDHPLLDPPAADLRISCAIIRPYLCFMHVVNYQIIDKVHTREKTQTVRVLLSNMRTHANCTLKGVTERMYKREFRDIFQFECKDF